MCIDSTCIISEVFGVWQATRTLSLEDNECGEPDTTQEDDDFIIGL